MPRPTPYVSSLVHCAQGIKTIPNDVDVDEYGQLSGEFPLPRGLIYAIQTTLNVQRPQDVEEAWKFNHPDRVGSSISTQVGCGVRGFFLRSLEQDFYLSEQRGRENMCLRSGRPGSAGLESHTSLSAKGRGKISFPTGSSSN